MNTQTSIQSKTALPELNLAHSVSIFDNNEIDLVNIYWEQNEVNSNTITFKSEMFPRNLLGEFCLYCIDRNIKMYCKESKKIYKDLLSITSAKLFLTEKGFLTYPLLDIELASYVYDGNQRHKYVEQVQNHLEKPFESEVKNIYYLGHHWEQTLSEKGLELWRSIECPLSFVLAIMESSGVRIDLPKLEELKAEYLKKSIELQEIVRNLLSDKDLNLNSPKQLSATLIQHGYKLGKPGKSGSPSVREDVLEQLSETDSTGVISKILEYRTVQKMYSTYTDSLIAKVDPKDSRLRGEYFQTVAATGRLSSGNPNLQNIPIRHPEYGKKIRSCFVAPHGKVLMSGDYSQMELRILAHFTEDSKLIEAFTNNIDIHKVTASEIFSIPVNEVTSAQRSLGKTLNFALMYQQGAQATAKQLKVSFQEGKKYQDLYFERFAGIKPFIQSTLEEARKNGFVETMYGRRAYYPGLNSTDGFEKSNSERAAFNMKIQGTEADLVKMAMIEMQKKLIPFFPNVLILLQIHDEVVLEVDEQIVDTVKSIVLEAMSLENPLKVPLTAEVHVGTTWSDTKS